MIRSAAGLLLMILMLLSATDVASARDEPPAMQAERAITSFLESSSPDAGAFLSEWLAREVVQEIGEADAAGTLAEIHAQLSGSEPMDVMIDPTGLISIEFGSPTQRPRWLHCQIQDGAPHRLLNVWIEGGPALVRNAQSMQRDEPGGGAITWGNLNDRLETEAANGFAGSILIERDGEIVLDSGFGMANRERGIANTPRTVFAIGSAPIDFTFVGIMQLQEQGELSYSDPITKYFPDVPSDKRSITIDHLMSGQSGLQNFHDIPSDADPDHFWISRDEAMQRIFSRKLLFAPGEGREHSHSAWGVLAAIIEIVSGQTYQEFTNERFFEPLGMRNTGFHGDPIPDERLAIGYGFRSDGEINAPTSWGTTSWLVMGSGGQVSTTHDMHRWAQAVLTGELLNDENTKRFLRASQGQLLNGGNAYGFEIYYTYTPGTSIVMLANAVDPQTRRAVGQLARDLGDLVLAGTKAPFVIGIEFAIGDDVISVGRVIEGGAAEHAGLRAGDTLIGLNGVAFDDDLMERLMPMLQWGEPIHFDVVRSVDPDAKVRRISVTPQRRP